MGDHYLDEKTLKAIENVMKSGLIKFIFGGIPDKVIESWGEKLLIYGWEKIDDRILEIARKYGADGVEMHITVPQNGRPHLSVYIYWIKGNEKHGCKIEQRYLDQLYPLKKSWIDSFEKRVRQRVKDYMQGNCKPKVLGKIT